MPITFKPRSRTNFLRGNPKVFAAMSGGVDSSVAVLLLKRQGYDVVGVFMKNWTENCEWQNDRRDAMRVCAKLNIPFLIFDFTKEYRREVIDYMVKEYIAGRTPNPDVMCNRRIKFGYFFKKARELGADYIATGHYICCRKIKNPAFDEVLDESRNNPTRWSTYLNIAKYFKLSNRNSVDIVDPRGFTPRRLSLTSENSNYSGPTTFSLYQAKDENKDQSYFLWTFTQKQLKHCLFPIGDYLKSEVREIARKAGLATADKKDSQGLCFVGKVKFRDFLGDLLRKKSRKSRNKKINGSKNGLIKTTNGKIIGEHKGLEFYTIGQRHGIGIGGGEPYFAAEKDIKNNVLIVAHKNDPAFFKKEIFVKDVNLIYLSYGLRKAVLCKARVRYRQPLQDCEVCANGKKRLRVLFKKPAWAVAPGQSIVFYKNSEMLGGGIIE